MASYKRAVEWIAEEDAPGDNDDEETLSGYISVCLVADLFGKEATQVAKDVVKHRVGATDKPRPR